MRASPVTVPPSLRSTSSTPSALLWRSHPSCSITPARPDPVLPRDRAPQPVSVSDNPRRGEIVMLTKQQFSTEPYQYAATDFGNIAYRETGSGPTVVFVHGVFVNGHLWDPLIERLAGIRRCIAVDILAHGATGARSDQDLSFDAQAAMLAAFCDAMELDRVDVIANDSGGGIAQIFAARHPERIRSLVLTDCDTHDNWPPKQAEPLHKLAKEGGVGPVGRRMLEDLSFARQSFAIG